MQHGPGGRQSRRPGRYRAAQSGSGKRWRSEYENVHSGVWRTPLPRAGYQGETASAGFLSTFGAQAHDRILALLEILPPDIEVKDGVRAALVASCAAIEEPDGPAGRRSPGGNRQQQKAGDQLSNHGFSIQSGPPALQSPGRHIDYHSKLFILNDISCLPVLAWGDYSGPRLRPAPAKGRA